MVLLLEDGLLLANPALAEVLDEYCPDWITNMESLKRIWKII